MNGKYQIALSVIVILALLYGCSGSGSHSFPVFPTTETTNYPPADGRVATHYLWSYNLVSVDTTIPENPTWEVIPVRIATGHLNVLQYLEDSPCDDCFELVNLSISDTGTYFAKIRITHPFDNQNLTGFDVRGICMFDGSGTFPGHGLTFSDRSLGDGEVLNADGFTSLYNGSTLGHEMEGYFQGKLASAQIPDAQLNGYKRFVSDDSSNTRNAFFACDAITVVYEVALPPGELVFGYAVDASHSPPLVKPVTDPMTDFGLDANCPEAWQLSVSVEPVGDGLTDCGGAVNLTVDVFDRQGDDTAHPLIFECPDFFAGEFGAMWVGDFDGYSRYLGMVENINDAPVGEYRCLLSKEAAENDPSGKPWLDLRAYKVIMLDVIEHPEHPPFASADAGNHHPNVGEVVFFDASESYDRDCDGEETVKYEWDWNGDGNFAEAGVITLHAWNEAGVYEVQLRVTDDEGSTDVLDWPIAVTVGGVGPYAPVVVTPDGLNQTPHDMAIQGNYAYVASENYGLQIFDITDRLKPQWVGEAAVAGRAFWVEVKGEYAYVSDYDNGLYVIDVDPPGSAHVVKLVEDVRGDMEILGNYAFMMKAYFYVVDISNPENAHRVAYIPFSYSQGYSSIDVCGNYAYLTYMYWGMDDDVKGVFKIIDISVPSMPTTAKSIVFDEYYLGTGGIAYADGYVYLSSNGKLKVLDVDPPSNANVVYSMSGGSQFLTTYNGYLYMLDGGGVKAFRIDDVDYLEYAGEIYLSGYPRTMCILGSNGYIANSDYGIQILDLSEPENITIAGKRESFSKIFGIDVSGNYAYTVAYNQVAVVDVGIPKNASVVRTVDISPNSLIGTDDGGRIVARDNYAYAGFDNLYILDIDPPESADLVTSLPSGYYNYSYIGLSGDYAITNNHHNLDISRIETPGSAYKAYSLDIGHISYDIDVHGDYAYVAGSDNVLEIIDIGTPDDAHIVGSVNGTSAACVTTIENYAFLGSGANLYVADISDSESPQIINTVPVPSVIYGFDVLGDFLYIADYMNDLLIYNIEDPSTPELVSSVPLPGQAMQVKVTNGYAFITHNGGYGIEIVKLW